MLQQSHKSLRTGQCCRGWNDRMMPIGSSLVCFCKPRAPRCLGGPTRTTSPSGRPAWTSSAAGLGSCPWCTPRWDWTPCCSGTRFPSWGRNTGTSRSCDRTHAVLPTERDIPHPVCVCVCVKKSRDKNAIKRESAHAPLKDMKYLTVYFYED